MEVDWDAMWSLRDEAHGDTCHVPAQKCEHTETYKDRVNGEVVCLGCGQVLDLVLEDVFGNTMPSKNIKPASLYKRRHHFNERLSQFTVSVRRVPDSVIDAVKKKLRNHFAITKTNIRMALRSLKQARHIENWIEVYCHVCNEPYPAPPREVLESVTQMFARVEVAFMKNRPPGRKCILHYNYIFHRLFEVHGLPQYFKWFPPLKSKAKLQVLDKMWHDMTCTLGMTMTPLAQNDSLR